LKATELIGKKAIRTAPVMEKVETNCDGFLFNGRIVEKSNYSYTEAPIKILKATDSHIVYEREKFDGEKVISVLNLKYCDDNWTDYDELIKLD
jgi:hypothetical protein